jgi:hypothetical protein
MSLSVMVLVGGLGALYLMGVGVSAIWTRKLQFVSWGRVLYGPLAQLCGLVLLAALPLSALSCGQLAYEAGVAEDPEPARKKVVQVLRGGIGTSDEEEKARLYGETRSAAKLLVVAWVFDFTALGAILALLVWALLDWQGVRPAPRRR